VLDRIEKTISRYNMLPAGSRVAAAVSGGPDSVFLLQVLAERAARLGISLAVAHFNHKLRGQESDEDERFVARLANRGLPFFRAEAGAEPVRGNLEQSTRRARREFLLGLIQSGAADRIALGHTRDDQAETVLFRILRGTGPPGLRGVLPVTADGFVRPLLDVTRAEVEDYLRARNLPWREDSSNRDPRFSRNRIRASLIPQLEREWNPRLREALARMADLAFEEELWWNAEIDRVTAGWFVQRNGAVEIRVERLAELPRALARRLLRRAIEAIKGDLARLEFLHIENALDLALQREGAGRSVIPGGIDIWRSFDWIRIARSGRADRLPPVQIEVPGSYETPLGLVQFRWKSEPDEDVEPVAPTKDFAPQKGATLNAADLNLGCVPARLELRGWESGDRFSPSTGRGEVSVRELLRRARVPSWRRRAWPIVTSGGRILWVRGFGAASGLSPKPGHPVLSICFLERDESIREPAPSIVETALLYF
jgi:tRNA(Ile)-lysidine synthase